jgi:hypothetical protein
VLEQLEVVLEQLAQSDYALWVQQSWGWAGALTLHAYGTATILGFITIMALRLFGLFPKIPFTALRSLVPFIWVAFLVQFLSGSTLWLTKPFSYLRDGMFAVKLAFIIISIIVMVWFQTMLKREAAGWDAAGTPSPKGVKVAAAICVLWACVVIGGRLTAYLGTLYPV